jgi:hypothetical protein
MKPRWMTSTGRLVAVAVSRLVVPLFWWNEVVRLIEHAPSVDVLDRFMFFRFMDSRVSRPPLQSLWEIIAAQKREQLLHLDKCRDPSSILDAAHRSTSGRESSSDLPHQGLRQHPELGTQLAASEYAHNPDLADEAPACDAEQSEQIDLSTQNGYGEAQETAPMEDQESQDSSYLHNKKEVTS